MNNVAVWAVTPNGARLAKRLQGAFPQTSVFLSPSLATEIDAAARFERLKPAVMERFNRHAGHIFIMSTGIVVRVIAPLLRSKTVDPAVVVVDELGVHAISLVAGHIGGANALALQVADAIDAVPIITTATDVNHLPAIDTLACDHGLVIENPEAIKRVSMAFLTGRRVRLHDPHSLIQDLLPPETIMKDDEDVTPGKDRPDGRLDVYPDIYPDIYIDDRVIDLPPEVLILRPRSLAIGMGCNRNTDRAEMEYLFMETLHQAGLCPKSVFAIASVDIKQDEAGLIALGESLGIPLVFFDRETLKNVSTIATPSAMVEKHIGVKSVCEAAAILAAGNGTLIVPKQNTKNVTAAVARISSMSSASAPAGPTTSAGGLTTCSGRSRPSPGTPPTSI